MNRSFVCSFLCLISFTFVMYIIFERNPNFASENHKQKENKFEKGICIATNICKRSSSDVHYQYVTDKAFLEAIHSEKEFTGAGKMEIPRVIHFTRFTRRHTYFRFHELMSVLAAHSAEQLHIYFWYDMEPFGTYWEKVLKIIPDIYLIHREVELHEDLHLQRYSRRIRLEVMLEFGGIGLDSDIMLLRPLTQLMHHDVTIGRTSNIASDDVVICRPRSPLLVQWFLKTEESGHLNSSKIFSQMATRPSSLVNVQPGLMTPNVKNLAFLYKQGRPQTIKGILCLKLWFRFHGVEHSPKELKTWNTTVGEIFRHFYYTVGKFKQ